MDTIKQTYSGRERLWLLGAAEGFGLAMKTMYPDAETFAGNEPDATRLVLTVIALEELAGA